MNVLNWLKTYPCGIEREWISKEKAGIGKPSVAASNSEMRRWCNTALLINGEHVTWDEEMDFPLFSASIFSGKNYTTLV